MAQSCGGTVVGLASLVLLGWTFGIDWLKSLSPPWVSMKPNTALCLVALGSSLLCSAARRDERNRPATLELGRLCPAAFAIVIAGLSLFEYLAREDFGIDQILFRDDPSAIRTVVPGRMAIDTALSVVSLGLAYCLRGPGGKRSPLSRLICAAILFLSAIVLLSYLYDIHPERGLGSGTPMAFLTAVCFFFLSAGLPLLDPERGLLGILCSHGAGGKVARRLIPATVLVPVLIAALKLLGDRMGVYEPSFGVIIVAVTYMILLTVLTSWTGRSLERSDREREAAEEAARIKDDLLNLTGEMAKVGGWEMDAATGKGTWTDEVARIHGIDPSIATNRSFGVGFYEGESRSRIEAAIGAAIAEARPYDLDLDLHTAGGEIKRVRTIGIPIVEKGRVVRLHGIFQDVSEMHRAQEELRQSEERFSRAFTASPMGESISSLAEGRIIAVNEAYCKILGYSRDELVGTRSVELGLFADPSSRAVLVSKLAKGRSVRDVQIDARAKSGKVKTVLLSMTPISLDGEACLIATVMDISRRMRAEKALRESEERYRGLFENMVEGFAYCRIEYELDKPADFTYLAVNTSFSRLTGLSDVVGRRASEVVPGIRERDPVFFELVTTVTTARVPDRFELEISSLGLWFAISVYFPAPGFFVAVFDVINERKEAEVKILELNAELEERVRRRTAQLEEANAELEAFSYSVSHDLRSPLRGIDGWSAAIEEDYGPSLDQTALGYLRRVREEARRMGALIDSLLQLAKVSRAEMSREDLDLSELVRATTARLAEAYPGRAFEFVIQSGLRAKGDRRLIEIALANLLDNACKYTAKRDVAKIEFGLLPDSSFFVRDNGAGFDMAYASKLFAPFQRMHKASEFPGTGIGLATVHRIVVKHGGKIWAAAAPDAGAVFHFTLEDTS
jgi:PAS domain S-box-containing protein